MFGLRLAKDGVLKYVDAGVRNSDNITVTHGINESEDYNNNNKTNQKFDTLGTV